MKIIIAIMLVTMLLITSCTISIQPINNDNTTTDNITMINEDSSKEVPSEALPVDNNSIINKSVSGLCISINDMPIGWSIKSDKQDGNHIRRVFSISHNAAVKETTSCAIYKYPSIDDAKYNYSNEYNAISQQYRTTSYDIGDECCYYKVKSDGSTTTVIFVRYHNIFYKITNSINIGNPTIDVTVYASSVYRKITK